MTAPVRNVDHLVIGGGPAGAMVALRLASAGRDVLLIEKESGPHDKVCGEFLSREAVEYLQQAGVSPLDLGATAIRTLRLSAGSKTITASLPFEALSLSRHVLDAALLARAEENGSQILRGTAVESLIPDGNHWIASLSGGDSIRTPNVFVATGKHNLRGFARSPSRQSDLVGFKMHWQLTPAQLRALRNCMDLYLFPGGYGGLSIIEGGIANLCLVVRRSRLRIAGGWPRLLDFILRGNRQLRQLLDGGTALWPRPLAISPIPYGYLIRESGGLWCVGDQAAVIPSFTGDGISIALHSGRPRRTNVPRRLKRRRLQPHAPRPAHPGYGPRNVALTCSRHRRWPHRSARRAHACSKRDALGRRVHADPTIFACFW